MLSIYGSVDRSRERVLYVLWHTVTLPLRLEHINNQEWCAAAVVRKGLALTYAIPLGTSEIFGIEMRRRQAVIDTIRDVYERFGFEPLHTPVLEYAEVFNGHHGEGEKLLFRLEDSQGNRLVNRYDLTVPLARFAANHPEIMRPLKRYQIESVFRDDEPDLGHFREFTQCDGDTIGNPCLSADAEVINLAYLGLSELGFDDFTIRVNHRGIIKAIAEKANIFDDAGILMVQRALDFSDKVTKSGISGIKTDLLDHGAPRNVVDVIIEMIQLDGDCALAKLAAIERALASSQVGCDAVNELYAILEMVPESILDKVSVDLTLARGADYYTGFILEGVITSVPIGAVLGGGRYDNLVGKFGGQLEPAVGMVFGLERIITAMKLLDMFDDIDLPERVLVVADDFSDTRSVLTSVTELRRSGIAVDYASSGAIDDITSYCSHRAFSALMQIADGKIIRYVGDDSLFHRMMTFFAWTAR